MFKVMINRIFSGRHYWRVVSFDEIAELYTSRLLTIFAVNIVNLFAAVYLYKLGYAVEFIVLFYGVLYLLKVPFSIVAAKYAAYFGPKHGILLANIVRIPSMVAFLLVPEFGFWAIVAFGVFQQIAATIYDLCYMVDFSKVKNSEHAGKEIGTMQIFDKIARIVSPIVGGVIASVYGPQVTIIVASVMLIVAAVPLFKTIEPTMTRNKLRIAGFPWHLARSSLAAESVIGFDFVASGMTWTLFMTLFVFENYGDATYAALGGLASLGVFIGMIAAWTFGQIVDRHKGGVLLVVGAAANMVVHLFRPFITSAPGVMGINTANEIATSAYVMPLTRVIFDVADSSGYRITYMMFIEMILNLGAALGCFTLYACIMMFGLREGMMVMFVAAAFYGLLLLLIHRAAK